MANLNKKSILWTIHRDELFRIANNSSSINGMLRYLGLSGSAFYTLKKRLNIENFDFNQFKIVKKVKEKKETLLTNSILIENSSFSRSLVKSRILKENLILKECAICGCSNQWQGKSLVLILDHINGVRDDHRLENLRLLCPNCNSQTETFAGRNKYKAKHNFCECGVIIAKSSVNCTKCAMKNLRKITWPDEIELKQLLWSKPMTLIAKDFKVSDKTVSKWIENYGLSKPPRGYWNKNMVGVV